MSARPTERPEGAGDGGRRMAQEQDTALPAFREQSTDATWLWTHLWLPLLAFLAAIAFISALELDWLLAHRIYAWEGYRWTLKKAFVMEALLHRTGRDLSVAAWAGVLVVWLMSFKRASLKTWRRPLGYLLLSVLLATLLISWIKSWSNVDCPWDIDGLGGTRPHIGLFEVRPAGLPNGRCFSAGHASGGYSWTALYFFFLMARPHLRWRGLGIGLGVGILFGIGQQLRGAHFLSHDLWTAMICWLVAFGLYCVFQRGKRPESRSGSATG